ncbi:MAG TPA: amidase [Candidatus Binatia bacterium]|jgi:aspartyl-tRNA(Asn)/glutamyl-tRNA(Gln) amidotransferase subunit A|nr:amidase [Candidatus Binatia bacterium]
MNTEDLESLTIAGLAPEIKSRKISPVELTRLFLDRIERLNPVLNAYVTVTGDKALGQAERADDEIAQGHYRGPLHGIPFSIKDNIATQGVRTTAGSKVLDKWIPDFDASVVAKLKDAGAIILGKTNLHEWALGGTTINPFYGTTRNPWDLNRIAGGSSGGSGAAVAASLCLGSIGTDSAQSVRNPASMCGVAGLKPTYGRISQYGTVAGTGAYSCNHTGIIAKTVEDAALVLAAVAGHDPKDPLSARQPVPKYSESLGKNVKGLKVGILRGYFEEVMAREVKETFDEAIGVLKGLGMETEEVTIPHMDLIPAVKVCTSRVENSSAHDHNLRTRARDYSPQTLYAYLSALLVPASSYLMAQRVRRIICDEFHALLQRFQLFALPTVGFTVPTIQECNDGWLNIDGKKIPRSDERGGADSLCAIPFNVTGLPSLSVCCGFSKATTPIGMQIAGGAFQEELIFTVAHAYERATDWHNQRPQVAVR